ncbi:MAG: TlpA family protein disulfide reductase [Solirubrobacteraceae bacterium]
MPEEDPSGSPAVDRPAGATKRRWWTLLALAVTATFVVMVVVSTHQAAVPVGASRAPGMAGMAMGPAGGLHLTMRDVDGRTVSLPDGRPGIVVFVQPRDCPACEQAARNAAIARRTGGGAASLTIVSADASTSRDDVTAFARAARAPSARYVVDDRAGTIASTLGASEIPFAVVYDARGEIVARSGVGRAQLLSEIRQAGQRQAAGR